MLYHSTGKIHRSHLLILSVKLLVATLMQPTHSVCNAPHAKYVWWWQRANWCLLYFRICFVVGKRCILRMFVWCWRRVCWCQGCLKWSIHWPFSECLEWWVSLSSVTLKPVLDLISWPKWLVFWLMKTHCSVNVLHCPIPLSSESVPWSSISSFPTTIPSISSPVSIVLTSVRICITSSFFFHFFFNV